MIKLENTGRVLARQVMVEVELPLDVNGMVGIRNPARFKTTEEGTCQTFRLGEELSQPIFPDSEVIMEKEFVRDVIHMDNQRQPILSFTKRVKVSIFADEMPAVRAVLQVSAVVHGWTPIETMNS
jgi:hypothetical protein